MKIFSRAKARTVTPSDFFRASPKPAPAPAAVITAPIDENQLQQFPDEYHSDEYGIFDGDTCGRSGCEGLMNRSSDDGCTCHIAPPCSSCTDATYQCSICEFETSLPLE